MKKIFFTLILCLFFMSCGEEKSDNSIVKLRMVSTSNEDLRKSYLEFLRKNLPSNIEIEYEFIPLENFDDILTVQLQSGEGPDIMEVGGETKLFARANYLLNLTNEEFIKKYSEKGIIPYTFENKVFAIPLQSWFEGIFYNKGLFKKYNLEVPKTWNEFLEIHNKLKKLGIKPQTMGAQSYQPMMKQTIGLVNATFYSQKENKNFDENFNKGKAKLAIGWLPALKQWNEMISKNYLTQDMLGLSYEQALEEFVQEKAAMWQSGPWAVDTIISKNPNLEFGMFPFPSNNSNDIGWLVGGPGAALAINRNSKHITEALLVLKLTSTPEAQKALIKDNMGISFLKGMSADLSPIYKECELTFKNGNIYAPWTAVWINGNAVTQAYGKSLQEVLAGTKTINEALEDADEINSNLLKDFE